MQNDEMNALKEFLGAVERGKELHPGPFSKIEWKGALLSEIAEFTREHCRECGFVGSCVGCKGMENGQFLKYRDEILDVAVAAYRFAEFLNGLITKRETKIAEADPNAK
jgi:hypothetical protein